MTNKSAFNPLRTPNSASVQPYPYIGLVKANDDPQRMGRLAVWIPEICGDPTEEGSWIICSYMSPFAGASDITKIANYTSDQNVAQQSYGWVGVPPDLNTEVMVMFVNGQLNRAYWIGCTYQQNMNHMVPGIPVDTTTQPGNPPPVAPTIEYNKANVQGTTTNPPRPVFAPLANGLNTQGLNTDNERGVDSSGMRREAPPLVYGFLTPRGNNVYVDDNPQNEFIRFRTRSGTQIMVDETTGFVYIISKLGNSWFEISDAGIDGFTSNSISLRAQQDLNVRADRNIILDAGANIFMRAGQQITLSAGTDIQAGAARNLILSAGAQGSFKTTNDLLFNSGGNLRLQSTSDTSSLAGGNWLRKGTNIIDNSGIVPGADANDAQGPIGKPVNDTTQGFSNGGSGNTVWKSGGGQVNTIVGRMPTHEPWFGHPNSKVPPPPTTNVTPNNAGTNNGSTQNSQNNPSNMTNQGCSFGTAGTKSISTDTYNAIQNASTQTGAPMATMLAIADQESGFNPNAQAGTSSASGLYQFINSTYSGMVTQYGNQYNVTPGSVLDANSNALMGGQLIQNNVQTLQNAGVSNPTPGQIYMLNFLGNSGGTSFIQQAQSNPSAPAASLFPAAASANRSIFYNSDGTSKTMSQVYNNVTSNIDNKATAYANQYGLPAPCQRGNGVAGNSPSTPSQAPGDASTFQNDVGKVYGDGQCVALVKDVSGLGQTSTWQQGNNVQQSIVSGNPPPIGTPVATFGQNGTYTNSLDGTSHAAVITGYQQDANGNYTGMTVLDQYVGKNGTPVPASIHTIPFNNSGTQVISNASNYNVINKPTGV